MQLKVATARSIKAAQVQILLMCIMLKILCVTPADWFHSSSITD